MLQKVSMIKIDSGTFLLKEHRILPTVKFFPKAFSLSEISHISKASSHGNIMKLKPEIRQNAGYSLPDLCIKTQKIYFLRQVN